MKRRQPVVAIDGPAGSGKSTVARQVAARLGFALLDTGALYRCAALAAIERGVDLTDGSALAALASGLSIRFDRRSLGRRVWLDGEEVTTAIRRPEISNAASQISEQPALRAALLSIQRDMGRSGGVVLEGRDIGTVVFPDAEVKVFLDAPVEIRARRRFEELRQGGLDVSMGQITAEVGERDARDEQRAVAPLRAADDAHRIETADLSVEQVVERIIDIVRGWECV